MEEYKIGKMRQHYYEYYEKLQYQLMIISGGTLTVFISVNNNNPTLYFYKYGFLMFGISLILGALSIFFFQAQLFLSTELNAIDYDLKNNNKNVSKDEEKIVSYLRRFVYGQYLLACNFIAGFLQFVCFVLGVIIILAGLISS